MGNCFNPLRRKIAFVKLVLASVSMTLWVRSESFIDRFVIHPVATTSYSIGSDRHGLSWIKENHFILGTPLPQSWRDVVSFVSKKETLHPHPLYLRSPEHRIDWRWKWYRFDFGELHKGSIQVEGVIDIDLTVKSWIVPHWAIGLLLILLTAYLLISKPRAKKIESIELPPKAEP